MAILEDTIVFEKEDLEKMKLLSKEELKKLNFHELCAYLNMLEVLEDVFERSE